MDLDIVNVLLRKYHQRILILHRGRLLFHGFDYPILLSLKVFPFQNEEHSAHMPRRSAMVAQMPSFQCKMQMFLIHGAGNLFVMEGGDDNR